jgi:hypothetical protein
MAKKIFLLSDQVIHWNIVPGAKRKNVYMEEWGNKSISRFMDLLGSYFNQKSELIDWTLRHSGLEIQTFENLNPANAAFNHVFATWNAFPEGREKAWRIGEIEHVGQASEVTATPPKHEDLAEADLLLIQDWGMKIRDLALPDEGDPRANRWIIYRPYPPVFKGNLWRSVSPNLGEKSVLVLSASDLRGLDVSISKGLSWEQTLQDLITEIYCERNLSLHPLRTTAYVVISFGNTGTLLIHNSVNQDGM